jgi:hypothetical protein
VKKLLIAIAFASVLILATVVPTSAGQNGTSMGATGTVVVVAPLTISNVLVHGITTNLATISWETNRSATSQVFYDTSSHANVTDYAYHSNLNNALVTRHSANIYGLLPSTTYHFRVRSSATISENNLLAFSENLSFKTAINHVAPGVSTLAGLPVFNKSAVLGGSLNYKGTSPEITVYFQWGKSTSYGNETEHQTIRHTPAVFRDMIGGLKANTVYHFRAVAEGDGISYGRDETFRTYRWPF